MDGSKSADGPRDLPISRLFPGCKCPSVMSLEQSTESYENEARGGGMIAARRRKKKTKKKTKKKKKKKK